MPWFDDVQIFLIVVLTATGLNFILFLIIARKIARNELLRHYESISNNSVSTRPFTEIFTTPNDDGKREKRVLFVIKDFSDLVLYFGPILFSSLRNNCDIFILNIQPCYGDRYFWFKHIADYVGQTVGFSSSNVAFVWDEHFPDKHTESADDPWPIPVLMQIIHSYAMRYDVDFITTYDADGINDNPGRQAINESVSALWRKRMIPKTTEIYLLTSASIMRSMAGLWDTPFSCLSSGSCRLMSSLNEFLILQRLYILCEWRNGVWTKIKGERRSDETFSSKTGRGRIENLIPRRKSHYISNEMNEGVFGGVLVGLGRSIGQQATKTTRAICLEHLLLVCWKRRSPAIFVYNYYSYLALLVGLISLATCPISTCSAKPLNSKRAVPTRPIPLSMISRTSNSYWEKYEPSAESAAYDDEVQTYLTEFGYLPKNNPEISNLRSDVAVKSAIARLQDYAGLNVTSKLDEPTKKLLKSKRCGMADIPYDGGGSDSRRGGGHKWRMKRYTIFGDKWNKLILTYKVVNYSPSMDQGETRRAVHDAFKLWSDMSALKFVETSDDAADILIEFASGNHGDGYPFDGKHVVLAHAFFPGSGRGGDAHFDLDETWTHLPSSYSDYEKVNFFTVAAHEFGHSLGLGHSKDRNALMFAYYKDYSQLSSLPYDDAIGIQKLYGVGDSGVPPTPLATTESPRPDTDLPSLATYAPPAAFTTPVPDACHSHIDAVARIRHEIFVFKGQYFWRYDDDGGITSDPVEISRFWHGFPTDLGGVDAIFERPNKDTIIFFKGQQYWEFSANYILPGYPRHISTIGMLNDVQRIDAAFVWDWSKRAYLFAGDRYWRLNDDDLTVEHDYPRHLHNFWKDVPSNVDAAFTDKEGDTYFFKDSEVYKFNNVFSRVDKHYPIKISEFWPQCRANTKNQLPYARRNTSINGGATSKMFDLWKLVLSIVFLALVQSRAVL